MPSIIVLDTLSPDGLALLDAAKEVHDSGTFGYLDRSIPTPDLNAFMKE